MSIDALNRLADRLRELLGERVLDIVIDCGEATLVVNGPDIATVGTLLRDTPDLAFKILLDVSGIDYQTYGQADWRTHDATASGFSRGVSRAQEQADNGHFPGRFGAVYHLLSVLESDAAAEVALKASDEQLVALNQYKRLHFFLAKTIHFASA